MAWPDCPATGDASAPPFRSWYFICASAAVRRGAVVSREFLGRSIVLFRGQHGDLHALSAHCSHMGAHLGHGRVVGDCIRCPLHHWEYDGEGVCRGIPATRAIPEQARQVSYPVVERYGGVFLFNGPEPLFPPPALAGGDPAAYQASPGRSVRLRCPATVLVANAFDMQHLQTVHERALRELPSLTRPDRHRLCLRYVSRVTGSQATDRVIRCLSGDRVVTSITCWGGSVLLIESDLGLIRSALLLGLLPVNGGVEVTPLFAVRCSALPAWDRLRVAAARWLFGGFLRRDSAILDDMAFRPILLAREDAVLQECLAFLRDLPGQPRAADATAAYA